MGDFETWSAGIKAAYESLSQAFVSFTGAWKTAAWVLSLDWLVRLGLAVYIVMRRWPVGMSLSWLLIVLMFPLVGPLTFLTLGLNWLGIVRSRWAEQMRQHYLPLETPPATLGLSRLGPGAQRLGTALADHQRDARRGPAGRQPLRTARHHRRRFSRDDRRHRRGAKELQHGVLHLGGRWVGG